MPQARLYVNLEMWATEAEIKAVTEVFNSVGLDVGVTADVFRVGANVLPDLVQVVGLSVPAIAAAFFGGAAGKAGADSWDAYRDGGWRGLHTFLARIGHARGQRTGEIEVRAAGHPAIRFRESIPDDAVIELGYLDWDALVEGWLSWDAGKREWRLLRPGADKAERAARAEGFPKRHPRGRWLGRRS